MKILHTADWHLDAPMEGDAGLRRELAGIPRKIAALCKNEGCDLMIIAGDLFDGLCSRQTLEEVMGVLEELARPVIITPGNHDFCGENYGNLAGKCPYFYPAPDHGTGSAGAGLPDLRRRLYLYGLPGAS